MPNVFISYARATETQAEQVAAALRAAGMEVWRDDQLPAHRAYSDVIEERLKSADAVVVLWSAAAAKSQWVRAEADAAREAGTLVQVTLDGALPPMPFNQFQCANLSGWRGNRSATDWRKVESSIEALTGTAPATQESETTARKRSGHSVCVLPFSNMSGDSEQEYFSDGISEDITTDLSKVSALAVTARNTAFTYKGQAVDICELARKLGVSHVLEGSVRKAGGRVRITAQLIDGATGDHAWAERYDRDLTDIFAIQDEISKAIVEALKVTLLPEEKQAIESRGTTNVDAYNLYLMARQQWITGVHGETRREESVIRLCDRVISIEPSYAAAWALKALAQTTLFFGYNVGSDDGVASADRALELDPSLPEAHSAKARAALYLRQFEAAEMHIQQALALSPESWEVNSEAARIYVWQHKFDEAVRYYVKCVALVPEDLHAWDMLLMAFRATRDQASEVHTARQMLAHAQAVIERDPQNHHAYARGANALIVLRDLPRAEDWIARALLIAPDNLDIRYNFACTLLAFPEYAELGLDHLEQVFSRSVGSIIRRADIDPDLDPVRDHPRFKAMYVAAMKRIAELDAGKAAAGATPTAGASAPPRS
jgi:adenylate cyclase